MIPPTLFRGRNFVTRTDTDGLGSISSARGSRVSVREKMVSGQGRFGRGGGRDAVDSATNRIAADADSHPVLADDICCVRVRKFPYMLVFVRESSDSLLVLALAHAKRRPGYWRRRR